MCIRFVGSVSGFGRLDSYFTLATIEPATIADWYPLIEGTGLAGGFMRAFHRLHIITVLSLVLLLAGSVPAGAQSSTPETAFGVDPNAACAMSRLRVGDLKTIDNTIQGGVDRATEEAHAWQSDSRLFTLRLGCPLLVSGVKWEGVFFSGAAQAFYETDTGKVEPVEVDPTLIPTLAPDRFRMSMVYDALIEYGFTDDLLLTAQGGVTIKTSTNELPFGPPNAPRGQVYAHLAVEQQDVIIDVWVSMTNGDIYTYKPI